MTTDPESGSRGMKASGMKEKTVPDHEKVTGNGFIFVQVLGIPPS